MIQRGLNKCGKKSSDPGMNKAQLYHYLRETFGVTKGGSTPASVEKALHELRKAGKAKMLQRGVWKAGVAKAHSTLALSPAAARLPAIRMRAVRIIGLYVFLIAPACQAGELGLAHASTTLEQTVAIT